MANEVKIECNSARQILESLGIEVDSLADAVQAPLGKVGYRAKVDLTGPVAVVELEVIDSCDDITFSLGAGHTMMQAMTYAYQAAEYQANPSTW